MWWSLDEPPLLKQMHLRLKPGGRAVVVQPTRSNLERHKRPSEAYLLEDDELPDLLEGLQILHYQQGWLDEGRHDAVAVAQRG